MGRDLRRFVEEAADRPGSLFPYAQRLGFRLTSIRDGRVSIAAEAGPDFHNPVGVTHGGLVFSLLDTCMGFAAMLTLDNGESWTALDVQIQFLRSSQEGPILGTGWVTRRGRRIIHLESEARDRNGGLLAKAISTSTVLEPR